MRLDDIRKNNKNAKLTWTVFPFGDLKWIKNQIKNAEKNKALAIVLCLDANVRSHRYKDIENFYDARKVGKRTKFKKHLTQRWKSIKTSILEELGKRMSPSNSTRKTILHKLIFMSV